VGFLVFKAPQMANAASSRVLFVSTQMEAAGVQVKAFHMLSAMQKDGVTGELLFLYRKRDVAQFDAQPWVRCLLDRPPSGPLDFFRILVRLARHIRAFRPTGVVGFAHYSSPIACGIALLMGVRRRVAVQANPAETFPAGARAVDRIVGTLGVYTANVAASQTVLDSFQNYPAAYRGRLTLVYNGVKAPKSDLTPAKARVKFGLPLDRPVLVTTGRLSAQKNQTVLLKALPMLPGVHLAILGEGELRAMLQAEAAALGVSGRVSFLGERPPGEVADFLKCGDVFVFPSIFEAFGLAVVEAMAAGLPVIASTHQSMHEVVGSAGVLVDPTSAQAWAQAIGDLLKDPESQMRLGAKARERAAGFSVERMAKGYAECLQ
jgi:glycosyltransferase involved in cell wall biosynthesis